MEYIFSKPYEFEGKVYESIEFDLDSITGADVSTVKRQFMAAGKTAQLYTTDLDFCAMLLAKVLKQPVEFMDQMPGKDYLKLATMVSVFLLN